MITNNKECRSNSEASLFRRKMIRLQQCENSNKKSHRMKLLVCLLTILGFHAALSNAFNIFDIFENGNGREFGESQNAKTSTESTVEGMHSEYSKFFLLSSNDD